MSNTNLVSAAKAACELGITKGCLYRMAREGIIPCFHVGVKGRSVRFDLDEIRQALREQFDVEDE